MKPTYPVSRQDLRRLRAYVLHAEIMHAIAPHIDPRGDTSMNAVARAILDLLMTQGVEILTDQVRAEMGLNKRDELGWTADEIAAYERRLMDALTRPMPPILFPLGKSS